VGGRGALRHFNDLSLKRIARADVHSSLLFS
jgi:hypothetical protein